MKKLNAKDILYVSDINENDSIGYILHDILNEKYNINVHNISVPKECNLAVKEIKKYLKHHPEIYIVISTGISAFDILQIEDIYRVVINPCLRPSYELLKNDSELVYSQVPLIFKKYENTFKRLIDGQAKGSTYSLFSSDDERYDYKFQYQKLFGMTLMNKLHSNNHILSKIELENFAIPIIENIFSEII